MGDVPKKPASEIPPVERHTEHIDPRLLELLVCPVTRTTLSYDAVNQELISKAARLAFPISKGVALLTIDAARELND